MNKILGKCLSKLVYSETTGFHPGTFVKRKYFTGMFLRALSLSLSLSLSLHLRITVQWLILLINYNIDFINSLMDFPRYRKLSFLFDYPNRLIKNWCCESKIVSKNTKPKKTIIKHRIKLVSRISSIILIFFRQFSFCFYNDTIFIFGLFVVVDSITFSKHYC